MADRDDAYEIAYDEALRAITDQQSVISGLHTRTGIVASAAALVLSLISQQARGSGLSVTLKLAVAAYSGIAVLSAFILWPRRRWHLHFQASKIHWFAIEGGRRLPSREIKRNLALYLEQYWERNGRKVDQLSWALGGAIALLLLEGGFLVYDLWGG